MATKPKSMLRLLVDTISSAVTAIDDRFEEAGLDFPSLHDPFDDKHPSTALLFEPDVAINVAVIVCATEQLSVSVRPPTTVLVEASLAHGKSASLNVAAATNVAEILREAGPQGLHVKAISEKNGVNADKLSRILRLLTNYHIFTEVEPDVFSNNRMSSALDTQKSTLELFSKPTEEKYVGAAGVSAFVELISGLLSKNSPYMIDAVIDPMTTNSVNRTETAFNAAYNTADDFWTWLKRPGNEKHNTSFIMAMDEFGKMDNGQSVLEGFPWDSLRDEAKVVDIGGGVGTMCMMVATKHPKVNFVVQDGPHVVNAKPIWDEKFPGYIDSGRTILQVHDFLTPQPVKDADLFFLRSIIHNWGHPYAVQILRHLRDAAIPGKTRLLLVDQVVKHSCKDSYGTTSKIELPADPPIPEGLLPSLGRASSMIYLLDMVMLSLFNAEERTTGKWNSVTKQAGWNITRIWAPPGSTMHHILAEPV